MKKNPFTQAVSTAVLAAVSLLTLACAPAMAKEPNHAAAAWDAFNAAFLVQQSGQTYYADTLTSLGTTNAGSWIGALDIAIAEDVYQQGHSPAQRQLVTDLLDTYLKQNSYDWKGDTWNDDIAWMVLAYTRGYQMIGKPAYLAQAIYAWNMAYDRGWNTTQGGGGIYENMNSINDGDGTMTKCALSNDPMITAALDLYLATGDSSYLDKSRRIYAWVRQWLFDATTGQVNEGMAYAKGATTGSLQPSDNAYNSGSFVEAANYLYRLTGEQSFHDDAQLAITHVISKGAVMHDGGRRGSQWQYRFMRALNEFCTFNGNCGQYHAWILGNAQAAWNMRDAAGLTWNDWTQPTADANPDALEMGSAVSIWQVLKMQDRSKAFAGKYEIQNLASTLALSVSAGSKANYAPVVQVPFVDGDKASLWKFEPIGNGFFHVRNVNSGLLLNVAAASGQPGALLVQWPAQGIAPGNDAWLPVKNSDGSFTFFNLNSTLALEMPGADTSVGKQFGQWFPNESAAQKFKLVRIGKTD